MKKLIILFLILCSISLSWAQVTLSNLNVKTSMTGVEKIPVSGSGNPAITGNLIRQHVVADSINNGFTSTAPSQNAVFDALALKQNTLVSGTSIRTINGNSLLGSGDLVISGGGGGGTWGSITGTLSSQTDLNSALNLKANLASPTFTGTVSGITASMVGLGNVNNTSDANKPVSTATQTALDLKANLASPALTGTPTAPTAASTTNNTQIATTAFVKAATPKEYGVALSDLTTALTAGVSKAYFRVPKGFTVTGVRASVITAQTSGALLTIDINENGASILSTKLTIDNSEKTSQTAAVPFVLSDTSLADDAEITFDVDQVGTGGLGLIVWIIGY